MSDRRRLTPNQQTITPLCSFFGNLNNNHYFVTVFFVRLHKRLTEELVSDRMQTKWCDIVSNVFAKTKDRVDDVTDSFCDKPIS